ncbi:MAG: hypothetical protein WEB06_19565 [Actinomycetota bacterium]
MSEENLRREEEGVFKLINRLVVDEVVVRDLALSCSDDAAKYALLQVSSALSAVGDLFSTREKIETVAVEIVAERQRRRVAEDAEIVDLDGRREERRQRIEDAEKKIAQILTGEEIARDLANKYWDDALLYPALMHAAKGIDRLYRVVEKTRMMRDAEEDREIAERSRA